MNDLPLHVTDISVDCDMLQMTQHCTHLETIFYKSAVICRTANIKYQTGATIIIIMVINPIKTKSMTIATKQKLSPLSFDLSLCGGEN